MAAIELNVSRSQPIVLDTMKVTLQLCHEGVSMQANLKKNQEHLEVLLQALRERGIEPSSFQIEKQKAWRTDNKSFLASMQISAVAPFDMKMISVMESVAGTQEFTVEIQTEFFSSVWTDARTKLIEEILKSASQEAEKIASAMGFQSARFVGMSETKSQEYCRPVLNLKSAAPQNPDGESLFLELQPPVASLDVSLNTSWELA